MAESRPRASRLGEPKWRFRYLLTQGPNRSSRRRHIQFRTDQAE
jgi:hypothetical protein